MGSGAVAFGRRVGVLRGGVWSIAFGLLVLGLVARGEEGVGGEGGEEGVKGNGSDAHAAAAAASGAFSQSSRLGRFFPAKSLGGKEGGGVGGGGGGEGGGGEDGGGWGGEGEEERERVYGLLNDDGDYADDLIEGGWGGKWTEGSLRLHGVALDTDGVTVMIPAGDSVVIGSKAYLDGDLVRGSYLVEVKGDVGRPSEDVMVNLALGGGGGGGGEGVEGSGLGVVGRLMRGGEEVEVKGNVEKDGNFMVGDSLGGVVGTGRGLLAESGRWREVLMSWAGEVRVEQGVVREGDEVEVELKNEREDGKMVLVTIGIVIGPDPSWGEEGGEGGGEGGGGFWGREGIVAPRAPSAVAQAMEGSLRKLHVFLEDSIAELEYQRNRLHRHQATLESTQQRVTLANVSLSIAVILVLTAQILAVRSIVGAAFATLLPLRGKTTDAPRQPIPTKQQQPTSAAAQRWGGNA